MEKQAIRLGHLVEERNTGRLGDQIIKLAQVTLLCTLPYSRTKERMVTRGARLGDGSEFRVSFSASKEGVDLPFGADRRLLHWLIDRAALSESPFVLWETARKYQNEVGISKSGRSNQRLQESFQRLRGLSVQVHHKNYLCHKEDNFFFIRQSCLPNSICGFDERNVARIDDFPGKYGIVIDPLFHQDVRRSRFHVAVPRELWRRLKGSSQVQDMVLFFYWRCYAAKDQSVVPWAALEEQFGVSCNPRKQRMLAKQAVVFLRELWPGCTAEVVSTGVLVDHVDTPLLSNDASARRVRVLTPLK